MLIKIILNNGDPDMGNYSPSEGLQEYELRQVRSLEDLRTTNINSSWDEAEMMRSLLFS